MKIRKATREYEAWLARRLTPIADDLAVKHRAMADEKGAFPFLRATFYRWAQVWPQVCPDLATAPAVLAVGDLHVDNFGTWRDREGRLVWGVNDLDEACSIPYANDLVRLAASAYLECQAGHRSLAIADACDAVLGGYAESLRHGGRPFILAEQHQWLLRMARSQERQATSFWKRLDGLSDHEGPLPESARDVLEQALPAVGLPYRTIHRLAGLGSLGRERYLALAEWCGGKIAREVKALLPSAWLWAHPGDEADGGREEILCSALLDRAVRCHDPCLEIHAQWVVRRLAPDCSRIEMEELDPGKDELRLLHAMGWEVGNIHLGSVEAVDAVRRDLKKRPARWLRDAVAAMVAATLADWKDWRKAQ